MKTSIEPRWMLVLALACGGLPADLGAAATAALPRPPLRPVVEVEEEVYSFTAADNGAGPMWCQGSTCLVRAGEDVFASGLETLPDHKPLNNCRWLLFRRGPKGWENIHADETGRTREPCPLAVFSEGRLYLSANPTLAAPGAYGGPARPELVEFAAAAPRRPGRVRVPEWEGKPAFTEHSYRSLAADGPNQELVLLQNIGYTHAEWAFFDRTGKWAARGQLKWPWGADYEKPQPIRICYPNVALKDRAVHLVGVSDIVEPNRVWREYKKTLTGREWDYDFRRLFYIHAPDLTRGGFGEWKEIASREKTCGWMTPGDLWVAPDGAAHLLWTERALDERLREKFFPEARQRHELNYAVVHRGEVTRRRTLLAAEEGGAREIPGRGRFQVLPGNRLVAFFYVSGRDAAGKSLSENRVIELLPDGSVSAAVRVPLQHPLSDCFTATIRGGSAPALCLDLLGTRAGAHLAISYARVRF